MQHANKKLQMQCVCCISATRVPDIIRDTTTDAPHPETTVIRFRLSELLAERAFKEGRRIEWQDVAEGAGIHRTTLSRMLNVRGYNASASNLDGLCRYFGCQVGELAEYVADADLDAPPQKSFRGPKPTAGRLAESSAKSQRVKKKSGAE